MELEDLKAYVKENYTDADKTNFIDSDEVREAHEKRMKKAYELRLKRCGKNIFKKWFYLGFGKDKEHNVYCHFTPFDKKRKKVFYKWRRNIEKKGITIGEKYYTKGSTTFNLFKNTKYYHKNIWQGIKNALEYTPNCSLWGMDDVIDYLMVKLTILGVYHGAGFSHVMSAKEQMHSIHIARKLLYQFIKSEDLYYSIKQKALQNQYHIDWEYIENLTPYSEEIYIKTGEVKPDLESNNIFIGINPKKVELSIFDSSVCKSERGRYLVIKKCHEIEDFWYSLDKDPDNLDFNYLAIFTNITKRKAFEYISDHFYEWGD